MIFYAPETTIGLCISAVPAILSIFIFYTTEKKNTALVLLMLSALMLRLLMISVDPFLHEWDEHFHALVAKNMMSDPFKPMLFAHPIVTHDMHDWSYSHIWLHKQPLFLWQMAISMKLFGVNEFAMRLPSALMSAIVVWLTYDIARIWVGHLRVAFMAALMSCFSNYALELVAGNLSLEHNDTAFIFYVTLGIWCFLKYTESPMKLKWAVLTGIAVGCAILNKWLTGYLVFGGWGIYLLTTYRRGMLRKPIKHFAIAFLVSIIVFLPWQIYITNVFPVESAISYKYNREHISMDLGHPGTWMSHFEMFPDAYQFWLWPFLLVGIGFALFSKKIKVKISYSMISMMLVLYVFFSFIVKTKMPTFTFPVSAILFLLLAIGSMESLRFIFDKLKLKATASTLVYGIFAIFLSYLILKPTQIIEHRSSANEQRNKNIFNTSLIKQMNDSIPEKYVVFNFRRYENIDYMFYKNGTGYHFYPDSTTVNSMLQKGHRLAAIDFTDSQKLPDYIKANPEILMLKEVFE